ncbi:unnamed protein product [Vicia faba]|uniref:Uncharacterized protein n=1 Tax=Vicia faba TaxID=3906 RepID=A0AAV0Z8A0_VICFA|nr:unnamed protein product [Vicia faba]
MCHAYKSYIKRLCYQIKMSLILCSVYIIPYNSQVVMFDYRNAFSNPLVVRLMERSKLIHLKNQLRQVTNINRSIIEISFNRTTINENGVLMQHIIKLVTNTDVFNMFEDFRIGVNKTPFELYVRFSRSADEVLSLCTKPCNLQYS